MDLKYFTSGHGHVEEHARKRCRASEENRSARQVQGLESSNECFSHQLSYKEKILVGSYKSDKVVVHLCKLTGGSESMESVRP